MRTTTLSCCELMPLPPSISHNSLPRSYLNLINVFDRRNSSSFWPSSSLGFSRCLYSCRPSSKFRARLYVEEAAEWEQTVHDGLKDLDCCSFKGTTELSHTRDHRDISYMSSINHNSENQRRIASGIRECNTSLRHLLMFAILFGSLTLQGTEQAVAASDFLNGLQSANFFEDLGDISTGFASAFLLIFFSELGDKTFFIAALLAARNSPAVVFTGTFGALAAMTIISVVLGRTFHYIDGILPFRFGGTDLPVDDIAAVCLLVYFGVSTLIDASSSDNIKAEDEQKEAELAVSEFSGNGAGILAAANTVISTFVLVFVAEWGDKSFFSTIALAAASSPLGVIGGALAGHAVATLLAVAGGSLLGTFLSEKVIAYVGGVLFLGFAGITMVEIIRG